MNRILSLSTIVVLQLFTGPLVSAEDDSPTDAERQAVALLAEKGAVVSIDRNYAVSTVTLSSGRNRGLGDDDLVHLQAFPALSSVSLSGSEFTDAGLKHLSALKNLQALNVFRTEITEEGIKKFKEDNPNCRVTARFGSGTPFGGTRRFGGRTRPSQNISMFASRSPSAERLRYDAVLDDLKLGQEQRQKIQELLTSTDHWKPFSELLQQSRSENDPDKRSALRQTLQETNNRLVKEFEASLREVLNPDQQARLDQLILQRKGPRALVEPEVASKLKLSESQASQLTRMVNEQARNRFRRRTAGEDDQEWEAKMLAVLTTEQRDAWKDLLGRPLSEGPGSRTP